MKFLNQLDFSTLLFDTIFGLILFYSFDSLLGIHDVGRLIFYLFSMFILIHWWLMFKSADDTFRDEVTDSAADIVFGIIDTIVLYYLIQYSGGADYRLAATVLVGLFAIDLVWAGAWRYIGRWRTEDARRVKDMEHELDKTMLLDLIFGIAFSLLYLYGRSATATAFITAYVMIYLLYIVFTFRFKILDMDIF